uniref:Uncharacterized protein n=1 Tax=Arundo donax TaxID=35708 RepID=A0A0A8YXF6_ARUDO
MKTNHKANSPHMRQDRKHRKPIAVYLQL